MAIRIKGSHSDTTAEKPVDDLTGLPNRIALLKRLMHSLESGGKHGGNLFAVLIMDLRLPENGVDGSRASDRDLLLVTTARRLGTWLKALETVSPPGRDYVLARSEGDKFIILIDELTNAGESIIIAERLLKEISIPFGVNGREVLVSANIGIALSATGYQKAQEILHDADTALYRSRLLGKGRCEIFDTAVLKSSKAGIEPETDLQQESGRQELSVFDTPVPSGLHRIRTAKIREKFRISRTLILTGSATIFLLVTAGLLDSNRTSTSVSPEETMRISTSAAVKPGLPPAAPVTAKSKKPLTADVKSEPRPETPVIPTNKKPLTVYEFPVVHDHFIGGCGGTLRATKKTLSYISEKGNCSFDLSYDEIELSLDGDRLEIKAGSKKYHFKSKNSPAGDENRHQIQDIFKRISKLKS